MDTATPQPRRFFIKRLKTNGFFWDHLRPKCGKAGGYCVFFAKVAEGMDVVEQNSRKCEPDESPAPGNVPA